jgi:hypothetical protein
MATRTATWLLFAILFVAPLVLMAWYPDTFTVGLRFVLRYCLEWALPIWTHAYCLWVTYKRRSGRLGSIAFVAFCCISIISFAGLAHFYTYTVFWAVTVLPGSYAIVSDLLSGNGRPLGHAQR